MEWHQIIQAVLALIFVIGLLLVTLWIFKYCEQQGNKCRLLRNLKSAQRLRIIEKKSLDTKNQIILIQADKVDYLLFISPNNTTILASNPILEEPSA